jgi:hypothetical protein
LLPLRRIANRRIVRPRIFLAARKLIGEIKPWQFQAPEGMCLWGKSLWIVQEADGYVQFAVKSLAEIAY